ncbi:MAG: ligand-binding sensor domain-containing protein [Thermotogota bacterium]
MTKKSLKTIIFILLFINIGVFINANNILLKENTLPLFDTLGREEGLANLSVSNIIQDKYGFLWFGTQGGLTKYDGKEMENFRTDPFDEDRLAHNLIQTMYYDSENHELWIGTYQGVSRFLIHEKSFINYTVEKTNLSNSVIVAIEKKGNEIWLGTLNGLNKLNLDTNEIVNYSVPGNVIRDLEIDSKGRLLIGTYEGLYYFDENKSGVSKIEIDLPSSFVMVVKELEKGVLTLGLWDGGVLKYDMETEKTSIQKFKDNRIYTIYKTTDGTLWAGTWGGGLFAVNERGKEFNFSGEDGTDNIPHPVVYSLFQDKTGIFWIGTNGGGIAKLNPRKSNYLMLSHGFKEEKKLPAGKVNSILKDNRGYLWISIYNSGINRYDIANKEMIRYTTDKDSENYIQNDSVVKIFETSEEEVLLASGDGVLRYDYDNNKFIRMNIFSEGTIVYAIEETENGDYWIGTYSKGAFKYTPESNDLIQYNHIEQGKSKLTDNLVYDILYDSKNRVWIGTNNGLNLLNPGQDDFIFFKEVEGARDQLGVDTVQTLFEDSNGKIWVGTNGGGISIYNEDKTFTNITEEEGLSSNFINGFLEGEEGDIWVSTNNGISIINPDSHEITILTPDDGIGAWEFNSGMFKDKDGNLYFGSVNGVSKIPGTFKDRNLPTPAIYITDVELFQKPIDIDHSFFNDMTMNFEPNENTISFRYSALDYDSPEKTKYIHYLKGFDDEWINSGERDYVTYSNLPFGEYEFMVYAKTIRGVMSDTVSFKFKIERPWYRTYTAYLLYILSFLLVLYSIFKIWEARILNEKNNELAEINDKLEKANKQLEELSVKDALTGVFNRRYFDSLMEDYLKLSKRGEAYLSLIMMDLDDFKDINDNFGHLAGDYILKDLSDVINSVLKRSTDYVSRYGGDEFVILLYDTNEEEALMIAEKIKKSVENLKIREEFSKASVEITVSIGLYAVQPNSNTKKDQIIERADKALYEAKKNGKNQIKIYNKK